MAERKASFLPVDDSDAASPTASRKLDRRKSRRSVTEANLANLANVVLEENPDDSPQSDVPLVELVAERLMKKVAWLTSAVKAMHKSQADLQSQLDTDFHEIHIEQQRCDVDIGQLRHRADTLESTLRMVQFSSPGTGGSGDEGGSGGSGNAEMMLTLVERLDNLQRDHLRLDSFIKHQAQQQEQKDFAQDELLTMELDAIKRELTTCVKASALEEQRKLMVSKIQHMETELKETVTGLNAEFQDQMIGDSRRVQEQLKQVSDAISSQISLLEEKILKNQQTDDLREQEVDQRLSALEKSIAQMQENQKAGDHPVAIRNEINPEDTPSPVVTTSLGKRVKKIETELGLPPAPDSDTPGASTIESITERISVIEQTLEHKLSELRAAKDSGGRTPTPDPAVSALVQRLASRVDAIEAKQTKSDSMAGGTYLTQGPDDTDSDTTGRLGTVEQKVGMLEGSIQKARLDDRRKLEELQKSLAGVQKVVDELKPGKGKSLPDDGNPLAWLEQKVSDMAKRQDRKDKGELPKRVGLLEVHQRDFDYRLNSVRGDMGEELAVQLEKVEQRFREQQQSQKQDEAFSGTSDPVQGAHSGKTTAASVTDDIWEEMQRLRCMIECLEMAVPLETRKAMEFFKRAPGNLPQDSSVTTELESKISAIATELERKTNTHHASVSTELSNVLRIVKGMEKENDILSSKIEDLCTIQPKVLNALEVAEVLLGSRESDGNEERRQMQSTMESLRKGKSTTLLNSKDFDIITQEIREDFDQNLGRMRAEFSSSLCAKADAADVTSLFGMIETLRTSTPGQSRPQTTDQYSRVPSRASSRGSMRTTNPRGTTTLPRSRASTPLGPNPGQRTTVWDGDHRSSGWPPSGLGQSQSTGRLPMVSK